MFGMSSLLALPLLRREEPELILYNGNIWTVDEAQPRARAVAIGGGRFLVVGSNDEVLPLATARTPKVDLAFKSVLPGFNDAHAHPIESGVEHLHKVACDKVRVRWRCRRRRSSGWIPLLRSRPITGRSFFLIAETR
jgi:predicted amidohydrolase YtcJ